MKRKLLTMLLLVAGATVCAQQKLTKSTPNLTNTNTEVPCREQIEFEISPNEDDCDRIDLKIQTLHVPKGTTSVTWEVYNDKNKVAQGSLKQVNVVDIVPPISLPDLPKGTYTFKLIPYPSGCPSNPKTFNIPAKNRLTMQLSPKKQVLGCGRECPEVWLQVEGGAQPYKYTYETLNRAYKPLCYRTYNNCNGTYNSKDIKPDEKEYCWDDLENKTSQRIVFPYANTWVVSVKDARDCVIIRDTVEINTRTAPKIGKITPQRCNSKDGKIPVKVDISSFGEGRLYYTLDNGEKKEIKDKQRSFIEYVDDAAPRTHKISLIDDYCSDDRPFEVPEPLTVTKAEIEGVVNCNMNGDIPAKVRVKGGNAPYYYTLEYQQKGSSTVTVSEIAQEVAFKGQEISLYLVNGEGTYRFKIHDTPTEGCPKEEVIAEITLESPTLTISGELITATQYSCKGGNTLSEAKISIAESIRDIKKYKVEIFNSNNNNTPVAEGYEYTLPDHNGGSFYAKITDIETGCSTSTNKVIVKPAAKLEIKTEVVRAASCDNDTEEIAINAQSVRKGEQTTLHYTVKGTNGYSEEKRTSENEWRLPLPVGQYVITVTDENTGCNDVKEYQVKGRNVFALEASRAIKATCANGEGTVTLTLVETAKSEVPVSPYFSYRVLSKVNNQVVTSGFVEANTTTLHFKGGSYVVEVTVKETGCTYTETIVIPENPTPIQVTATPLYSKDCTQENGEIALHISGGQAPYKVRLVHQNTKNELTQTLNSSVYTFTGVTAGSYTIEVQDAAGCSRYEGTTSVTVQPSFVLKDISFETLKKATCERKEEVLVKVAVTPEYVKGTWLKYIITSEDKKYRREIRLDDTSLQLNGTEALGVGKYHIEVLNEQTKCSIGEDYEVKSVAEYYRLVVGTPVKATCSSGKGLLTLSIQNKEASATKVSAFDYRITANSVVTGTSTNGSAMIRLSAGSYQIEVTVVETGCKLYGKVIMPEPPAALKLATTVQASANCEDAKGAAIVQVSGGVSPYTITLTHKRTGAVYSETNVGVGANAITLNFSDLKSGYYYAHVQDTAGCEAMGAVTIEEYTPIALSKLNAEVIAPSCGDANDGKLIFEVQVSGGVPPYKYKLEKKTEKTSEHTLITVTNGRGYIENLSSGSYQLLVEDSKNCIATITETTIIAPKPITVDIKINKSHSQACDDSQNGSVTLSNIAGGSGFYRIYLINHEKKTVVDRRIGVKAGETVTFGNLASSYNIHYEIAIQDSKGCLLAHLAPFTIDEEPDVAVQSVENEINCDPTSNKGYVHTLVVKFNNNVVDYDKISYNLNNGTERSFTRTAGNIAFIDDFDAETLTQTLTVNYKPMGVGRPICPASIVNFSLTRFPQFTLERVPNDDLNVIEVIAKGGVTDPLSGYTYYFNGENQGNNPVYTIKNTDPERIEAGGVRIKTIEVKAKDAKDCIRTLVVEVPYIDIDIPNYFTPNGDGDNDRWRPKKMEDFPNAFVHVFDRNGRRMAILKPGESWDGIYAGKPMPSGDYWYTIDLNDELRDGRKIYGHFSLYR
uniref:T9SS type B sorting domain-containing protein n=1 Tax=Capnocytophaga leadbetteri TaxID=327575 RepID=UPI0028D6AFCE|nr:T9SS type B sorting domain-containing protein [Capnocytophaga leadbetteri]